MPPVTRFGAAECPLDAAREQRAAARGTCTRLGRPASGPTDRPQPVSRNDQGVAAVRRTLRCIRSSLFGAMDSGFVNDPAQAIGLHGY